ncbi:MAG: hypothetical protein JO022_08185, partial [Acidobacteriaceae bacterium]|nr:hypothetical protein [Acidobacteriaceae bacterium]
MRCLYCGKQLALFRRLTGSGEFCSDAHKQSYHEEYNRLALTRLIAAQSRTEDLRPLSAGGTREGGNSRALPEARPGTVHQRWGDLSRPARMLEAPPPEPTPPPQQSFIIKKNVPASSKGLQWLDPVVDCSALCIELNKPSWDPSFA